MAVGSSRAGQHVHHGPVVCPVWLACGELGRTASPIHWTRGRNWGSGSSSTSCWPCVACRYIPAAVMRARLGHRARPMETRRGQGRVGRVEPDADPPTAPSNCVASVDEPGRLAPIGVRAPWPAFCAPRVGPRPHTAATAFACRPVRHLVLQRRRARARRPQPRRRCVTEWLLRASIFCHWFCAGRDPSSQSPKFSPHCCVASVDLYNADWQRRSVRTYAAVQKIHHCFSFDCWLAASQFPSGNCSAVQTALSLRYDPVQTGAQRAAGPEHVPCPADVRA